MINTYHQLPTLLVGLGGFGSGIADRVYQKVQDYHGVEAFCIDTDIYTANLLQAVKRDRFICLSMQTPLPEMLNALPDAQNWFPRHPMLHHKVLSEGAGQIRAVSRLAFEYALLYNRFHGLLSTAHRMAETCVSHGSQMRISIATTLTGGTGAGIFIQTALMLRDYLATQFPSLKVKIHGEFVLPANFRFLMSAHELTNMEALAYASLKELNHINKHFFHNGPTVKLRYNADNPSQLQSVEALPYDYCYLYDHSSGESRFDADGIANAIVQRLFGAGSDEIHGAFLTGLRSCIRKKADNLYCLVNYEQLPEGTPLTASKLYRSKYRCHRVLAVSGPPDRVLQSPADTQLVSIVDETAQSISITELCCGVSISQIDSMKYLTGRYYHSYKKQSDPAAGGISPHLDRSWDTVLPDIGAPLPTFVPDIQPSALQKNPDSAYVFISYSSRNAPIARQIRQILEANGIPCWMAPESIPAGSDYGTEIPHAIGTCKAFLLLLSEASQQSQWVPKEVGLAIGKGKTIVPFQIDDAPITDAFNFYLINSQRISAHNRITEASPELTKRLRDLLK